MALDHALPRARGDAKAGLQKYGEYSPEAGHIIDTLELDAERLLDDTWWPDGGTPPPG